MLEMLGEARVIFEEEIRRTVRTRAYVIIALSVPVIMLVLLVAVPAIRGIVEGKEEEEPKPIGIVNLSESLSLDTEAFPGVVVLAGRDEGIEELSQEDIKELFVIPRDYLATGSVEWVHSGGGPDPSDSSAAVVVVILRISLAVEELPREFLGRALSDVSFESVRIGPDGLPLEEDEDAIVGKAILTAISALLLMFAIMGTAGTLTQAVAEEKESRMIEVLLISARPLSLMAAKVLALGVSGLAVIIVWGGSVVVIVPRIFDTIPDAPELGVDPVTVVWVVAFFLAGYFFSAVILAGIGAASTGIKEANQAAMLVIMPNMVPMYALMAIIPSPDGALARTLSFIPFTAPLTMMLRLAFGEPSVMEVLASLALMALSGLALLWVSARIFRAGLLMYGQRMSIRRAFSALREAG